MDYKAFLDTEHDTAEKEFWRLHARHEDQQKIYWQGYAEAMMNALNAYSGHTPIETNTTEEK